jgi:hypothetical protein
MKGFLEKRNEEEPALDCGGLRAKDLLCSELRIPALQAGAQVHYEGHKQSMQLGKPPSQHFPKFKQQSRPTKEHTERHERSTRRNGSGNQDTHCAQTHRELTIASNRAHRLSATPFDCRGAAASVDDDGCWTWPIHRARRPTPLSGSMSASPYLHAVTRSRAV